MDILVVDDHQATALALCGLLEDFGNRVSIEYNGQNALERLRAEPFAIVFTDWVMPGMDGLELCREIRKSQSDYVYTILVTVKNSPEDRIAALKAGADDFLVKPIDPAELISRLRVAGRILAMKQLLHEGSTKIRHLSGAMEQRGTLLGNILLSEGSLTANQLTEAQNVQTNTGRSLYDVLYDSGEVSREHLTRARGVQIDMPYVDVSNENPDPFVLALVSPEIAIRSQSLPLSVRSDTATSIARLTIATADPWNIETIDEIQRSTHCRVETVLASDEGLKIAIDKAYRAIQADNTRIAVSDSIELLKINAVTERNDAVNISETIRRSDEAPIVRFVDSLFSDAVRQRASDIHLEPHRIDFEIFYRIDGRLKSIRTIPRQFLEAAVSRIKIMADIDISERRLPLDGRITLAYESRRIDLRVSTLPTQFGERLVVRLLDQGSACMTVDQLGFSTSNLSSFEELIHRPHGLILVTGPTGSGKTTTLYAALNAIGKINERDPRYKKNIITCEDPIEYEIAGVSQSNVNEKAGLTFARQLRAILRQDPDVVLVGEIRDAETAEIAFRAAMTGHLVLSTLHCNEAAGAIGRLLDMGIPAFLIASALSGVIGQHLVRRLCPHCRRQTAPDPIRKGIWEATFGDAEMDFPIYEAPGCPECDSVGLHGRLAIHEVLVADDRIRRLTMDHVEVDVIRRHAIACGMIPVELDALEKIKQGITTIDEVHTQISKSTRSGRAFIAHAEDAGFTALIAA